MSPRAPTAYSILLVLVASLLALTPATAAGAPNLAASAPVSAPGSLCDQQVTGSSGGRQTIVVTCGYTGAEQYWQAPTRSTGMSITAAGASGGDSKCLGVPDAGNHCTYGGRGRGASVSTPLSSVAAAGFYQARVGGRGEDGSYQDVDSAGGWNGGGTGTRGFDRQIGGGGGGATDLRAAPYGLAERIVVAGGGGGAGDPAYPAYTVKPAAGGQGGPDGTKGNTGGLYVTCIGCYDAPDGGGQGGTQAAGGTGGPRDPYYSRGRAGGDGGLGQGGTGEQAGGGGGGGLYGGGGGNGPDGGGGGGGSSAAPTGATITSGTGDGNGTMRISYVTDYRTAPLPTCTAGAADTAYQTAVTMPLRCEDPTGALLLRGFSIDQVPAHGTATISDPVGGEVLYTPAAGFVGTDTFTYRNTSANGEGVPVTMAVTVAVPVPTCRDVSASGVGGALVTVDCDLNPDYPLGSIELVGPVTGTIAFEDLERGQLAYTSPDGFVGTEELQYRVLLRGGQVSAPARLHLVAEPPPRPACPDADTTARADTGIEPLLLVCPRSDGFARTFAVVTPPAHGSASITATETALATAEYVPEDGFEGTDTFTYAATNRSGTGAPATVTVVVGPPAQPTTCDDRAVSLYAGQTATIPLHCSGPAAGFSNRYYTFNGPQSGAVGVVDQAAATVTYTAPVGPGGPDSLSYSATNGTAAANGGSAWATVTLSVSAVPVPTCRPLVVSALVDTPQPVGPVCTSIGGHPQTYAATLAPVHGTLTGPDPGTGATTYTPEHGYRGPDSFTLTSSNDAGTSAPLVVQVSVRRPAVTCADATIALPAGAAADARLTCTAADTITVVDPPASGTLTGPDPATGVVTYTPQPGFFGTDSFTFLGANPDHRSLVHTATVTVSAPAVPTCAPVATTTVVPGSTRPLLLSCASTPGFPVRYAVLGGPAHGTLAGLDAASGQFSYTPQPGFRGTDELTYTAQNVSGSSVPVVARIEVGPAPHAFDLPVVGSHVVGGRVVLTFRFPFQGRARFALTSADGHRTPLRAPRTVSGAEGEIRTLALRLNAATRRALAHDHRLSARLRVRYRPDGSTSRTHVVRVVLRTPHAGSGTVRR